MFFKEFLLYVINLFEMLHLVVFLTVFGRAFKLFQYDVSSAPVSVHLPVSRFLAGQFILETFRFYDEDDYEVFSVLSRAGALTSVILAGERDSHRHSTTS